MFALCAAMATAQPADDDALLRARWDVAVTQAAQERGLAVSAGLISVPDGSPASAAAKTAVYRSALARLLADPALRNRFIPDESLVNQTTPPEEAAWITRLAESGAGERGAKAVNASSTNPTAPRVAERSGFTDFVALALDSQNIVAADKSAVSLNLNAIALLGLTSNTLAAPAAYRRFDGLRRLGGTVVFGAQVPEKAVTGLSGLPTADTLFDVFSWDVKLRVIGDRDPRARRWYTVMLGDLGGLGEIAATLGAFVPISDLATLQPVLNDALGAAVQDVRNRVGHSFQLTVKGAGQHLTTETGRSRYAFGLLGDKGFGDTDLTFNILYSTTGDISTAPGSSFAPVKTWSVAVAVNTLVAKDVLVRGRATEVSLNASVDAPVDAGALPLERKRVWNIVGAITLPWGDAAKIPVSVSLTDDPNSVTKNTYVRGHIGVSYDFGALKSLFRPQSR